MKKTSSPTTSNQFKLTAVFLAGFAVATLGWYYSDRLNIAFGRSADIDLIQLDPGHSPVGPRECMPGNKTDVVRTLDGCDLVTHTTSCLPVRKYINYVRTHSGVHSYESDAPRRGSHAITRYLTSTHDEKHNIQDELADAAHQVEQYSHGKSMSALAQDAHYQELVTAHKEIKALGGKVIPRICPPVIHTQ